MSTLRTSQRRARKGAVVGVSSVAAGLATAVGLLWMADRDDAPAPSPKVAYATSPCGAIANFVFAAL